MWKQIPLKRDYINLCYTNNRIKKKTNASFHAQRLLNLQLNMNHVLQKELKYHVKVNLDQLKIQLQICEIQEQ